MPTIRRILDLAWVDRRLTRRDPVGLLFVVVVPLVVVVVLGPIYVAEDRGAEPVAVVIEGTGPVSALLDDRLAGNPGIEVTRFHGRAAADRAVRRQDMSAAVVVPASVDDPARGPTEVVLVGPPGVAAPSGVRAAVESATAETAAIVSVARTVRPDDPLGTGLVEAEERADAALADTPEPADDPEARRNSALADAIFGTAVLFTFMNTMAKSSLLAIYRELGVLARLRTTPTSSTQVSAGFALGLGSFAIAQVLLAMAASSLVLGVSWRQPAVLVAVLVVVGVTAGAFGALTGTLLPSSTSGVTIAGPAAFALAALGGCLWPLSFVAAPLRVIGHLTPHAWALDALYAVKNGDPTTDWLAPTVVLAGFAVVAAVVAGLRLRAVMQRAI